MVSAQGGVSGSGPGGGICPRGVSASGPKGVSAQGVFASGPGGVPHPPVDRQTPVTTSRAVNTISLGEGYYL